MISLSSDHIGPAVLQQISSSIRKHSCIDFLKGYVKVPVTLDSPFIRNAASD